LFFPEEDLAELTSAMRWAKASVGGEEKRRLPEQAA
jgi:hypothetical protein